MNVTAEQIAESIDVVKRASADMHAGATTRFTAYTAQHIDALLAAHSALQAELATLRSVSDDMVPDLLATGRQMVADLRAELAEERAVVAALTYELTTAFVEIDNFDNPSQFASNGSSLPSKKASQDVDAVVADARKWHRAGIGQAAGELHAASQRPDDASGPGVTE